MKPVPQNEIILQSTQQHQVLQVQLLLHCHKAKTYYKLMVQVRYFLTHSQLSHSTPSLWERNIFKPAGDVKFCSVSNGFSQQTGQHTKSIHSDANIQLCQSCATAQDKKDTREGMKMIENQKGRQDLVLCTAMCKHFMKQMHRDAPALPAQEDSLNLQKRLEQIRDTAIPRSSQQKKLDVNIKFIQRFFSL